MWPGILPFVRPGDRRVRNASSRVAIATRQRRPGPHFHAGEMSKALIIAEKPSVANDIARALGGFKKHDDYFESDDYVLSSAVGHLVEIAAPEEYDVKRGKWSFANLPVIPPHFDLNPIAKTESRLKLLTRLIKRKDVDQLINACDAGREGELIFRLIAQHAKAKQPVQRLWLQSMTHGAIRDGFTQLRSDEQMHPLADAASCRSEADWLVGINGTRAMTAFNSKGGGFFLTTVGRVQTPTLSIVVEREEKIKQFVPRDYWEVQAEFVRRGRRLSGPLVRPEVQAHRRRRPPARLAAVEQDRGRLDRRGLPRQDRHRHRGSEAVDVDGAAAVRPDDAAARSERPLRLLGQEHARPGAGAVRKAQGADLSADRLPHLPEDYIDTVKETLRDAEGLEQLSPVGVDGAEEGWVKPNKRIFDNSKISDHFAIIPTLRGAEEPVGARAEALRPRRQALPRGVLPAGRVPGHDAHHRGVRASVQDRRQGAGRAGLAAGLRQGSAGRRRQPRPGRAGREAADREGRGASVS